MFCCRLWLAFCSNLKGLRFLQKHGRNLVRVRFEEVRCSSRSDSGGQFTLVCAMPWLIFSQFGKGPAHLVQHGNHLMPRMLTYRSVILEWQGGKFDSTGQMDRGSFRLWVGTFNRGAVVHHMFRKYYVMHVSFELVGMLSPSDGIQVDDNNWSPSSPGSLLWRCAQSCDNLSRGMSLFPVTTVLSRVPEHYTHLIYFY